MAKLYIQGRSANNPMNKGSAKGPPPPKLQIQGKSANYAGKKSPNTPNPPNLQIQTGVDNYAGRKVSRKKIAGIGS
jgi:hypothetical protein